MWLLHKEIGISLLKYTKYFILTIRQVTFVYEYVIITLISSGDGGDCLVGIILNITMVILEIIACSWAFKRNGASILKFYTVLSNILGGVSAAMFLLAKLLWDEVPMWVTMLRYCSVVCLMQTFLVVVLVLAPMTKPPDTLYGLLFERSQKFHHIICPLLTAASFLFFEGGCPFGTVHKLLAVAPTLLYAAVTIPLNWYGKLRGPYPFLYVRENKWYVSIMWAVVVLGLTFAIAFGCAAVRSGILK